MLLDNLDPTIAIVLALATLVALEAWRRTLRNRAPRWVHVTTIAMLVLLAGGAAYSQLAVRHLIHAVSTGEVSTKATELATGISNALRGYVIAVLAAILAVIVLAVASIRARDVPPGGPIARVR